MKNSIKSKLFIAIGLLAGFLILLTISGLIFINTLAENSGAIIQDNIRSVSYAQQMEQALNDLYTIQISALNTPKQAEVIQTESYSQHVQRIEAILEDQKANITETGERELTNHLQENFNSLVGSFESALNSSENTLLVISQQLTPAYHRLQQNLSQLTTMNVDAIHRKNQVAQQTASNVTLYMSAIGALCSIFGIGMLLRFPGYIVNPIEELIDRIQKIANRNYDQRLDFHTGDEYEELAEAFNQMAGKLQEYENSNLNRIMSEKKRVETIINNMSDAVIGLDAKNYILFANNRAIEIIGLDKNEMIGKYAPDIASRNDLLHQMIRPLLSKNGQDTGFLKIGESNETYYSVEIIPVQHSDQEKADEDLYLGNIIALKNVTRFHELDQAKTNFISVVSHELKTPISSINMSLRLLGDERVGNLNDEQRDLLSNIQKDVRRMKQTTSDLLDLTKIESGNIQINTEETTPGNLLEYAYETMLLQADQKDISIDMDVEDSLAKVVADSQKTVWVLVNLISNAIRYTESNGTITLKASQADNPEFIQFTVRDTGSGIEAEDLDKIFDKYYQVEKNQKDRSGSGLGLSIAKEFIIAQKGKIWAESKPGEGSTFYFLLPTIKR